jgi:hypothetical protein
MTKSLEVSVIPVWVAFCFGVLGTVLLYQVVFYRQFEPVRAALAQYEVSIANEHLNDVGPEPPAELQPVDEAGAKANEQQQQVLSDRHAQWVRYKHAVEAFDRFITNVKESVHD